MHLPKQELLEAFHSIRRLLKPGGRVLVQRVGKCDGLDVVANELVILAVEAEAVPTAVDAEVISRDGCDQ